MSKLKIKGRCTFVKQLVPSQDLGHYLKKQAKEEDADIFWGDETGIRNDESKGRSYAPKGKTPVQMVNPVPEKINMISAISNQGKLHFMFYRETMSAQKMIEFMERVIHDNERKVFLILDNLRVHHSKVLDEFLKENVAFIKLFFLPSYSPDLNPDEYLNRDLKANLNNKPLGRAKGKSEREERKTCAIPYERPINSFRTCDQTFSCRKRFICNLS